MRIVAQAHYAQALYDNQAGTGTDKAVSKAIMVSINDLLGTATNVPTGSDLSPTKVDHKADTKSALSDVAKLYAGQATGSVSATILGEDHNDDKDHQRALDFIAAVDDGTLDPTMVVYERGMNYADPTTGVPVVRENNLTTVQAGDFGMGLSRKQRSMVVGGYVALCIAGGDQNDIDRVLAFFGANHFDICDYVDYFARHTSASYVEKEARTFLLVRSYVR